MRSQCSPFGRVSMNAMNSSTFMVPDGDAGALAVISFISFGPSFRTRSRDMTAIVFPVELL
jgi:hypothetical protein